MTSRRRSTGLVYIASLAPDEGETSQNLQDQFPVTDIFSHTYDVDSSHAAMLSHPDFILDVIRTAANSI